MAYRSASAIPRLLAGERRVDLGGGDDALDLGAAAARLRAASAHSAADLLASGGEVRRSYLPLAGSGREQMRKVVMKRANGAFLSAFFCFLKEGKRERRRREFHAFSWFH